MTITIQKIFHIFQYSSCNLTANNSIILGSASNLNIHVFASTLDELLKFGQVSNFFDNLLVIWTHYVEKLGNYLIDFYGINSS